MTAADKTRKLLTVAVVCRDNKVLLGMKKKGFGMGRWNGFGGKVEQGESVEDAADRELNEESGIKSQDLRRMGIIEFTFDNDPKLLEVHFFKVTQYSGEPIESDEMRPQWFENNQIPFGQMWSDDQYWMPMLLSDKKFRGKFHFDRPSDNDYSAKILKMELQEVDVF